MISSLSATANGTFIPFSSRPRDSSGSLGAFFAMTHDKIVGCNPFVHIGKCKPNERMRFIGIEHEPPWRNDFIIWVVLPFAKVLDWYSLAVHLDPSVQGTGELLIDAIGYFLRVRCLDDSNHAFLRSPLFSFPI